MEYKLLDKISSPSDVKKIDAHEMPALCQEIREFLINNVAKTGGHLASNLGAVELSVAVHKVFDSPTDHIIFDVGHQAYAHKILTGRKDKFSTIRTTGGLSAFTSIKESEHDAFGAGHSSTSVSAALGFAEADKLCGKDSYTVAILGDGAYTGGMVHEALNNCSPDLKLVIILNENGMSISVNKGRFASYLSRVRASKGYRKWKNGTKSFVGKIPLIGSPLSKFLSFLKEKIKNFFMSPNYFEDLGLYYIGPVDGNDYKKVESALQEAKSLSKTVIVHLKTTKGKGFSPAEKSPDDFHSVYSGTLEDSSFHSVCAQSLVDFAKNDPQIIAITPAMGIGTGFAAFEKEFPERYFDVGIAEEHAVTFAAGLAANGYNPCVGIYSTFLQRGYDQIIHDVCLQNLPVKFFVDRASLAVSDGATHHGIFDVAFLSHIPNMTVLSPMTYGSLCEAVKYALQSKTPIAVRYPNAKESELVDKTFYPDGNYKSFGVKADFEKGEDIPFVFITYGNIIKKVMAAKESLTERGYKVGIVLLEKLKPYNEISDAVLQYISKAKRIVFAEEGIKNGGAAMLLREELMKKDSLIAQKYLIAAIEDNFASPENKCNLYEELKIGPASLAEKMIE